MADKVIRIKDLRPQDVRGDRYTLHRGNVLDAYPDWEAPDLIELRPVCWTLLIRIQP